MDKLKIGDTIKTIFGPARIFNFYNRNWTLFAQVQFDTGHFGNVAINTMTIKI
jgi:hypothetical protein